MVGAVVFLVVVALAAVPIYYIQKPGFDLAKIAVLLHVFGMDVWRAALVASKIVLGLASSVTLSITAGVSYVAALVAVVAVWAAVRALWIVRPDQNGRIPSREAIMIRWRVKARRRLIFSAADLSLKRSDLPTPPTEIPKLKKPRVRRNMGVTWTMRLPSGVSRRSVGKYTEALESSVDRLWGVTGSKVDIPLNPKGIEGKSWGEITVWASDPLRLTVPWPSHVWPTSTVPPLDSDPFEGFALGYEGDGSLVRSSPVGGHWMAGGTTGYGKSMFQRVHTMNALIGAVVHHIPTSFIHLDMGAVELAKTRPICSAATSDPEEAGRVLRWLVQHEKKRREAHLVEHGKSGFGQGADRVPFTAEFPWLVVMVDEADVLFKDHDRPGSGKQRQEDLEDLLQRWRKLGAHVLICTQNPLVKAGVFSSEAKAMLTWRVSFYALSHDNAEVILGEYDRAQPNPTSLDPDDPGSVGQAFSRLADGALKHWKGFLVEDAIYTQAIALGVDSEWVVHLDLDIEEPEPQKKRRRKKRKNRRNGPTDDPLAEAFATLVTHSGWTVEETMADPKGAYRAAQKNVYPDQGGTDADSQAVSAAWATIEQELAKQ